MVVGTNVNCGLDLIFRAQFVNGMSEYTWFTDIRERLARL